MLCKKYFCLAILCCVFCVFFVPFASGGEKNDVPDAKSLEKATATVRDLFKKEYRGKKIENRHKLVKLLLSESENCKDMPTDQYAILNEAVGIAAEAGEIASAIQAIRAMDKYFKIDRLKRTTEALATARKAATKKQFAPLATAFYDHAAALMQRDNFDHADDMAKYAIRYARIVKQKGIVSASRDLRKEIARLKKEFPAICKARDQLKNNPDEPGANYIVGKYLCLTRADWKKGLPMLAKGDKPNWQAAAQKDLAGAKPSAEKATIGNTWYELAETEKNKPAKIAVMLRAEFWYRQAMANLKGLAKRKIEVRLKKIAKITTSQFLKSDKDLVLYLSFDRKTISKGKGGYRVKDLSGNGHDGEIFGASVVAGKTNEALQFDGKSHYVAIPHSKDMAFSKNQSYTLCTWVYVPTPSGKWAGIVIKSRDKPPYYGIVINPKNKWAYAGPSILPGSKATKGWHFVAAIQNAKTKKRALYVDGKIVVSGATANTNGKDVMYIGRSLNTECFNGKVDEVRLYRKALSKKELRKIANQ